MPRTTVAIEASLLRQIKVRAAREEKTLQQSVNELLRLGLQTQRRSVFRLRLDTWDGIQNSGVDLFDRNALVDAMERG